MEMSRLVLIHRARIWLF